VSNPEQGRKQREERVWKDKHLLGKKKRPHKGGTPTKKNTTLVHGVTGKKKKKL